MRNCFPYPGKKTVTNSYFLFSCVPTVAAAAAAAVQSGIIQQGWEEEEEEEGRKRRRRFGFLFSFFPTQNLGFDNGRKYHLKDN